MFYLNSSCKHYFYSNHVSLRVAAAKNGSGPSPTPVLFQKTAPPEPPPASKPTAPPPAPIQKPAPAPVQPSPPPPEPRRQAAPTPPPLKPQTKPMDVPRQKTQQSVEDRLMMQDPKPEPPSPRQSFPTAEDKLLNPAVYQRRT